MLRPNVGLRSVVLLATSLSLGLACSKDESDNGSGFDDGGDGATTGGDDGGDDGSDGGGDDGGTGTGGDGGTGDGGTGDGGTGDGGTSGDDGGTTDGGGTTSTEPYECPNGELPNSPLPSSVDGHTDNGFAMLSAVCTDQPTTGKELVYTFTSPADGFYEFTTTSTNDFADTVLFLLDETCDGEQLACGDETDSTMGAAVTTSNIAKYLKADQVVQVVVDGKVFTGTEFTLTVDEVQADCIDEVITDSLPITVMGDTTGRPNRMTGTCFGESGDYSFEWTVPATATYQIDTIGSSPGHEDTVLYVLDGNDCAGEELACSDDVMLGMDRDSKLEVDLAQDQVVTIVVDGWSGSIEGPFTLNIQEV